MKIGLLKERIPEPVRLLRILLLRPEIIIHDLVAGKLKQQLIAEAEKYLLLQTIVVQKQELITIEVVRRQVVLIISEHIIAPDDQKNHKLFRQIITDLPLIITVRPPQNM
jgi:hypothetical protein